jgi:hypothetical protein
MEGDEIVGEAMSYVNSLVNSGIPSTSEQMLEIADCRVIHEMFDQILSKAFQHALKAFV